MTKQPKIKILYYYSNTCKPCKQQGIVIHKLVEDYSNMELVSINIEDCEDTKYPVSAVPTIVIELDGEFKWQFTGLTTRQEILDELEL